MRGVETLDGTTYELTVMDVHTGLPQAMRLFLRSDGVHLHRASGEQVWSVPWSRVEAARHEANTVWLVGSNDDFLASVAPVRLRAQDTRAIWAELTRFHERYGRVVSEPAIDPRILVLRDQARTRNGGR
jgi:hypothetical protein